jgi:sugar phosphate permease
MDTLAAGRTSEDAQQLAPIYRKVTMRILPFIILCYLFSYLDRVNVGFAKLAMLDELRFSETAYGLGAGIFFLGYLLFEVPSNFFLMRIGARMTLSRIMFLWGILSICTAFVHTETQFYIVRFLIGAAEAGFFPGVLLYLTFWFPSAKRARMTAAFLTAIPLSGIIGSPFSGYLLTHLHAVFGLAGWQWLFIIEGIPSVLLAALVPLCLSDTPEKARWLSSHEKTMLLGELKHDEMVKRASVDAKESIRDTLRDGRMWLLTVLGICQASAVYGVSFWLPTLVKNLGHTDPVTIGWLTAIPFTCAAIAINLVAFTSDRFRERRWHLSIAYFATALLLFSLARYHGDPQTALLLLTFATGAAYSATMILFTLPPLMISGVGLAGAVALINSVSAIGGFVSPYFMGLVVDATHSTSGGLLFISATSTLGAVLVFLMPKRAINR